MGNLKYLGLVTILVYIASRDTELFMVVVGVITFVKFSIDYLEGK